MAGGAIAKLSVAPSFRRHLLRHGHNLGILHNARSEHAAAMDCYERSLAIFRELGRRPCTDLPLRPEATEVRVVMDDDDAIAGEMQIRLDHVGAELDRALEGRVRILGALAGRSAMGDDGVIG